MKHRLKEWEKPEMLSVLRFWSRDGCSITTIAEKMGITRTTLYQWMRESQRLTSAIKMGKLISVAYAEDKLMRKIEEGDITAIIFYLKSNRKTVYNWPQSMGIEPEDGEEDAAALNEIMDVLENRVPEDDAI